MPTENQCHPLIDDNSCHPPDVQKLKQQGNQAYKENNVSEAITLWKRALKQALKNSVTDTSETWIKLQTDLRLNIALGLIKEEDYILAKEHILTVLDRNPTHPKALYRLAQIYQGLHDLEGAINICKKSQTLHPDDQAFMALQSQIMQKQRVVKATTFHVELDHLNDLRSTSPEPPKSRVVLDNKIVDFKLLQESIGKIIKWHHKQPLSDEPSKAQQLDHADDDLDDYNDRNRWLTYYNRDRLDDDRAVCKHALPFSILYALEVFIRSKNDAGITHINGFQLPLLHQVDLSDGKDLRSKFTTGLTRVGVNPFTIHVVDSRGDDEMEILWTSLLARLPALDRLQLFLIGFDEPSDGYSTTLKQSDYLSPQLSKIVGSQHRKIICRLYKGTYLEFLESETVRRTFKSAEPKIVYIDSVEVKQDPILYDNEHIAHPDLVVFPRCNLSRYFDKLVPIISKLLLSNVPILFLAHSVLEYISHEAAQIPGVLTQLAANFVIQPYWNPYMIACQPDEHAPKMSVRRLDGSLDIDYKGPSAKYAVSSMVQGFKYNRENFHRLMKITHSNIGLSEFKEECRTKGLDVDWEAKAMNNIALDVEFQKMKLEANQTLERKVERQAETLQTLLETKLAG